MIALPRDLIKATKYSGHRCDLSPIQVGMGRDPWKVIVASQLLQRTRRNERITKELFDWWPTPGALAASDTALEDLLRPLGLHRVRARQLQRMSLRYAEWAFEDIRDLPGCGPYVCDAVGLFCYGCTDLDSSDEVLHEYAFSYTGPSIEDVTVEALRAYESQLEVHA